MSFVKHSFSSPIISEFLSIKQHYDTINIRFIVYADGSICLDILQNKWSPTYDVSAILTSIQVCISFLSQLPFWQCIVYTVELINIRSSSLLTCVFVVAILVPIGRAEPELARQLVRGAAVPGEPARVRATGARDRRGELALGGLVGAGRDANRVAACARRCRRASASTRRADGHQLNY